LYRLPKQGFALPIAPAFVLSQFKKAAAIKWKGDKRGSTISSLIIQLT
jgi:hypothetical protein